MKLEPVKINKVYEVMAKKLHGINNVPAGYQGRMIKHSAKAGALMMLEMRDSELLDLVNNIKDE